MRATSLIIITAASLAGTALTVLGGTLAESCGGSETNLPPLAAIMRHEEGPGLLPSDRVYATAGTNKFSFVVPPGYKMETWSDGRVALVNQDYSSQITFRLAGPPPADGSELNPDACSERVLAEYPGAKIIKGFSAIADSRRGPAFEFQCNGTAGALRRAQIAFIPSWSAVVEFSLACSPEKFDAVRQQLNTVMLTFRASDPKGELHISPLSDKI
jgi:hypothetical protein